ncbi:DUF4421 family protein [Sediminicola luteus]|nr:DUF4421 family protein [Sediminicola luteus]
MLLLKICQRPIFVFGLWMGLFWFGLPSAYGQEDDKPLFNFSSPRDTTYRRPLFDYLQFKLDLNTDINSLITDTGEDDTLLEMAPNEKVLMRLSLDYKFLGVAIDFAPGFLPDNKDDDLKGETKFRRLGFRFNLGRTYNILEYENVQGYYLVGDEPYELLPELRTQTYRYKTSYIFGDRFSLRAIKAQTEKQLQSAGAFIPSFEFQFQEYDLNEEEAGLIGLPFPIREHKMNFVVSGGYSYTWVFWDDFFFNLSGVLGAGVSLEKDYINNTHAPLDYIMGLGGSMSMGYSSKRFFAGFEVEGSAEEFAYSVFPYQKSNTASILYVGIRLDAPRFIEEPFSWVERKTGF